MYDYLGAAYTGLIEAIDRYDPDSEVPFEKYAYFRVRGAIIDYIRKSSSLTPREYNAARLLRASDCLSEDFQYIKARIGKADMDQSLAEVLDYAARGGLVFRLNYIDHEEEILDEKYVTQSPEELTIERQVQKIILQSVAELPPREQEIIYSYYFEGKTFQEIGDGPLKASRSWVCRMHSRAIRVLRKKVTDRLHSEGVSYE